MDAVSRQRWLLGLASLAFVLWIGYLAYLVAMHDRPVVKLNPPGINKTPEVVVSHSQLLEADLVVSARLDDLKGPAEDCKVLWHRRGINVDNVHGTLVITNLFECVEPDAREFQPGRYLLPLVKDGDSYRVAAVPPTPGFPVHTPGRAGKPRIYPDTRETRAQLEEILHLPALPD